MTRRTLGRVAFLPLCVVLVLAMSGLAFASTGGGGATDRTATASEDHATDGSGSGHGRIRVTKDADMEAVAATGADVTFTFTVHNDTDLRFWITSLTDDVFGTLAGDADCAVGTELPAGGSCSFEHTAWLEGEVDGEHVNTFTAQVEHYGWVLTASDSETVVFLAAPRDGELIVHKAADREHVPASGAHVLFTFEVHNDTDAELEIASLEDDVFGTLAGDADCEVGTVLPADGSCWFTHEAWLHGSVGDEHVNTVTVTAMVAGTTEVLTDTDTETVGYVAPDAAVLGESGENRGDAAVAGRAGAGGTAFTGGNVSAAIIAGLALAGIGAALVIAARRASRIG